VWLVAAVAAAVTLLTGILTPDGALDVLVRLWPIVLFLVSVTVLADLADDSGLFDVTARELAHWGGGRAWRLWLLMAALATVATIMLSLDTTAVLLTPVVLAMAAQLELPALPFAMLTVWLANTASLLLPISNLTNLLAQDSLDLSTPAFAALSWPAAVVSVVVTVAVLAVRFRRDLRGTYVVPPHPGVEDRVLFWVSATVCALLGPLVVLGLPFAAVATGLALVLVAAFAVRRRSVLRFSLVPWRLVVLVVGLFVVVAGAHAHGLDETLLQLTGTGGSTGDLLQLGAVATVGANVVNNLPAYAALEPTADGGLRTMALLVGVNCGPLVLLWGSLATLLWRERCRARGLEISWRGFGALGLAGVPLVVCASILATSMLSG
jgi:arsenical pump membrane protein